MRLRKEPLLFQEVITLDWKKHQEEKLLFVFKKAEIHIPVIPMVWEIGVKLKAIFGGMF